jgi:hypothetical protein
LNKRAPTAPPRLTGSRQSGQRTCRWSAAATAISAHSRWSAWPAAVRARKGTSTHTTRTHTHTHRHTDTHMHTHTTANTTTSNRRQSKSLNNHREHTHLVSCMTQRRWQTESNQNSIRACRGGGCQRTASKGHDGWGQGDQAPRGLTAAWRGRLRKKHNQQSRATAFCRLAMNSKLSATRGDDGRASL